MLGCVLLETAVRWGIVIPLPSSPPAWAPFARDLHHRSIAGFYPQADSNIEQKSLSLFQGRRLTEGILHAEDTFRNARRQREHLVSRLGASVEDLRLGT